MESSYTSPLTVVRDVETSILDGTVLKFLYVGQGREDGGKRGRVVKGRIAGGIEQIIKYVNTSKCGRGEKWTGK